jgi:hypothetical protein
VTSTDFYGVDVGPERAPASTEDLLQVFRFLKPRRSARPLIRIGGDRDGAYLVPDDLDGITACFSPGVNRIKFFEDALTDDYGIRSHMCDFTCRAEQFTTPLRTGAQTFQQKWLEVEPGPDNLVLADWVASEPDGDLLLQMDIEGAEFRNLLHAPDAVLDRFRVIVLEVHRLGAMLDGPTLHTVIAPFFERLARSFTTVHAHPNNCCGDFAIPGTDVRIPNVLEITLVRDDRFAPADGPAPLPHPLDVARNVPRNAPLFLGEAWVDGVRPWESRIKVLEDTVAYQQERDAAVQRDELAAVLAMTTECVHTAQRALARQTPTELTEVAAGRPYRLSSAYGSTPATGTVTAREPYFFHTDFGPGQTITVDLGAPQRIWRIELSNRRGSHQERARHTFATLIAADGTRSTFPVGADGGRLGDAWDEGVVEVPDVEAREIVISTPIATALHLSDVRVYALAGTDVPMSRAEARRQAALTPPGA